MPHKRKPISILRRRQARAHAVSERFGSRIRKVITDLVSGKAVVTQGNPFPRHNPIPFFRPAELIAFLSIYQRSLISNELSVFDSAVASKATDRFHRKSVARRERLNKLYLGLPKPVYYQIGSDKVRVSKTYHVTYMPNKKRRARKSGSGGGSGEVAVGLRGVVRGDLLLAPSQPTQVPQRVPRQFARQIVWDTFKVDSTISLTLATNVETNFAFIITASPQLASWVALYDQYFIAQVAVSFANLEAPGALTSLPVLHSAVDFDNTTALGSLAAIETFESHLVDVLSPGKTVTRMCRPCVQSQVVPGAGVGIANSRFWLATVNTNVSWYGIRSWFEGTAGATATVIHTTVTYWVAWRSGV